MNGGEVEAIDDPVVVAVLLPLGHIPSDRHFGAVLIVEAVLKVIGASSVARLTGVRPVSVPMPTPFRSDKEAIND